MDPLSPQKSGVSTWETIEKMKWESHFWEFMAKDPPVCDFKRQGSCVLLLHISRASSGNSLALQYSSVAVGEKVQALRTLKSVSPHGSASAHYNPRPRILKPWRIARLAPNIHQASPKESTMWRYTLYVPVWDHCQSDWQNASPKFRASANTNIPVSPKNMDSEHEFKLETKWFGLCMMSGKTKKVPYLFQSSKRRLNGYHTWAS
jgi:hypothetical protein